MQPRLQQALLQLSPTLQTALAPIVSRPDFAAVLTAKEISELQHATQLAESELLTALLPLAAAYAITPISHFNVGAIAKSQQGHLYFGANMEFSGLPLHQSVHAEQCAIVHAWMKGVEQLQSITINYPPCGYCRQFMRELNSSGQLQIQLPGAAATPLIHYLPCSFGPEDLDVNLHLMDNMQHNIQLTTTDPLLLAALEAARRSYAPYTHTYSGIALELQNHTIISGCYSENAAFNPSLSPLQAALALLNIYGYSTQSIQRVALVETEGAISQKQGTEILLAQLTTAPLIYRQTKKQQR